MTLPFVPDPKNYKPLDSLWAVWLQARRVPHSKFNFWVTFGIFLAAVVFAVMERPSATALLATTRSVVSDGFQFAGVVLGFLLAGFTVFATLSAREFFHALAGVKHETRAGKQCGLSWLEFCYCIFIETMATCLAYMGGCLAVQFLGFPHGPVASLVARARNHEAIREAIVYAAFAVVAASTVLILLVLKSFIYNVYHLLLSALRFDAEQLAAEMRRARPKDDPPS